MDKKHKILTQSRAASNCMTAVVVFEPIPACASGQFPIVFIYFYDADRFYHFVKSFPRFRLQFRQELFAVFSL
jgi:hypothetical protein